MAYCEHIKAECPQTAHHKECPRADKNKLFKLVEALLTAGFRGSSQSVVDTHILQYQDDIRNKRKAGE